MKTLPLGLIKRSVRQPPVREGSWRLLAWRSSPHELKTGKKASSPLTHRLQGLCHETQGVPLEFWRTALFWASPKICFTDFVMLNLHTGIKPYRQQQQCTALSLLHSPSELSPPFIGSHIPPVPANTPLVSAAKPHIPWTSKLGKQRQT